MRNNTRNIRAVDIGIGFTKFTTSTHDTCRSFPSFALPVRPHRTDSKTSGRGAAEVCADGMMYEVATDTRAWANHRSIAMVRGERSATVEYRAFLHAALHQMQVDHLDLLVAGLPLHDYSTHHGTVSQRLRGTHIVRPDISVEIEDAIVVPTPLGGLVAYLHERGDDWKRPMDRNYLLVDAGYATLSWICTNGLRQIPGRCGSVFFGMSEYLSCIRQVLNQVLDRCYPYTHKIDEGLRRGRLRISGREFDIPLLRLFADSVVMRAVNAMCDHVGVLRGLQEIDQVVIIGGGSESFLPGLVRAFPDRDIHTVTNPQFASVRGFHLIGQSGLNIEECFPWKIDPM